MALQYHLMVEGKDDEYVLSHLFQQHGINPKRIFFSSDPEGGGVERLLKDLKGELASSGLDCLGIVIDADADIAARWMSLRGRLTGFGYSSVPTIPQAEGTVLVEVGRPVVGVWLMPNNQRPGMLEHFVELLVPDGDPLWPRAQECVRQIPLEQRPFSPSYEQKAIVHTWLAWQKQPGTPLGWAVTKKYFDAHTEDAERFIAWVRRLFPFDAGGAA